MGTDSTLEWSISHYNSMQRKMWCNVLPNFKRWVFIFITWMQTSPLSMGCCNVSAVLGNQIMWTPWDWVNNAGRQLHFWFWVSQSTPTGCVQVCVTLVEIASTQDTGAHCCLRRWVGLSRGSCKHRHLSVKVNIYRSIVERTEAIAGKHWLVLILAVVKIWWVLH